MHLQINVPWNWSTKLEISHLRAHIISQLTISKCILWAVTVWAWHQNGKSWKTRSTQSIALASSNIWLSKADTHMHTKIHNRTINSNLTERCDEPKMTFYPIFSVLIQLIVGGICGSVKHHGDSKKEDYIQSVFLSSTHSHSHKHTL